jgi:hypothetical protein
MKKLIVLLTVALLLTACDPSEDVTVKDGSIVATTTGPSIPTPSTLPSEAPKSTVGTQVPPPPVASSTAPSRGLSEASCFSVVLIHGGGFFLPNGGDMQSFADPNWLDPSIERFDVNYPLTTPPVGSKWYPQKDIYGSELSKRDAFEWALETVLLNIFFRVNHSCKLIIIGVSAGGTLAIAAGIRWNAYVISVNGPAIFEDVEQLSNSEYVVVRSEEDTIVESLSITQTCIYVQPCRILESPGGHGDLRVYYAGKQLMKDYIDGHS